MNHAHCRIAHIRFKEAFAASLREPLHDFMNRITGLWMRDRDGSYRILAGQEAAPSNSPWSAA